MNMRSSTQSNQTLIVGFGVSGLSVARHLIAAGVAFDVADQNAEQARSALQSLLKDAEGGSPSTARIGIKDIRIIEDDWTASLFSGYARLVVSPGVATRTDNFNSARKSGIEVIGDVELFARATSKPVIAVTGSNGKSTVVSMTGEILRAAGLRAAVVGNVGLACLDGLDDSSIDVYVLELSSFQLETTGSLEPAVATVLNVSEDHMDRYDSFDDYAAVKRSVYRGAAMAVVNANDQQTVPDDKSVTQTNVSAASNMSNTTGNSAIKADWSLRATTDGAVILQGPNNIEVDASALQVDGSHNQYNALVSMALVKALFNSEQNLPASISELRGSTAALSRVFANGLKRFTGLPHRTQLVRHSDGVSWFNDSKGTNVGACVSAIEGLTGPVVLIAGGQGKGADFSPLAPAIAAKCRAVILIGEDADILHRAIGDPVPVYQESTLADAVDRAATVAQTGDSVLLSPACASFDMFANFEARGDAFADEVNRLCA